MGRKLNVELEGSGLVVDNCCGNKCMVTKGRLTTRCPEEGEKTSKFYG